MAEGTGESQTEDCGFTHQHSHTLTQKHTDSLLTGESREQPLQTFKIRKDMQKHHESVIFQEQYKNKYAMGLFQLLFSGTIFYIQI